MHEESALYATEPTPSVDFTRLLGGRGGLSLYFMLCFCFVACLDLSLYDFPLTIPPPPSATIMDDAMGSGPQPRPDGRGAVVPARRGRSRPHLRPQRELSGCSVGVRHARRAGRPGVYAPHRCQRRHTAPCQISSVMYCFRSFSCVYRDGGGGVTFDSNQAPASGQQSSPETRQLQDELSS